MKTCRNTVSRTACTDSRVENMRSMVRSSSSRNIETTARFTAPLETGVDARGLGLAAAGKDEILMIDESIRRIKEELPAESGPSLTRLNALDSVTSALRTESRSDRRARGGAMRR